MGDKNTESKETICMIGTLVPEQWYNEVNEKGGVKSAASPLFMQKMICQSLISQGADVTVFGYPSVAAFPRSSWLGTWGKRGNIGGSIPVRVIPFLNILGFKQITVFLSMLVAVLAWNIRNKKKRRSVLVYADFLEYGLPAIWISHLFRSKVAMFLTELPGAEHYSKGKRGVKEKLTIIYERMKMKTYRHYDGYVFTSRKLSEVVPTGRRPWTVVEAFADTALFEKIKRNQKPPVRTAMYAGGLGGAYNIEAMVEGFHRLEGEYALWVYGGGEKEDYVRQMAVMDPRIQYFGRVRREIVLEAERKAHVLLHTKTDEDEHSKYCFSTKIVEYMLSGTPVLSTHVEGIPDEYYKYMYLIETAAPEGIREALEKAFCKDDRELEKKGGQARNFVMENKNCHMQGQKIIRLLHDM